MVGKRMTDADEFSGLRDVHSVISYSAEVLAALIETIRGGEVVSDDLLLVADRSLNDLTEWRLKLRELMAQSTDSKDLDGQLH